MLTGFFIEKIKRKLGIKQLKTSDDVIQYLSDYDWPGNVRELEHLLSRAALKASSKQKDKKMVTIRLNDCDLLSNTLLSEDAYSNGEDIKHQNLPKKDLMNLRQEVDEFQKKLISMVLKEENGA